MLRSPKPSLLRRTIATSLWSTVVRFLFFPLHRTVVLVNVIFLLTLLLQNSWYSELTKRHPISPKCTTLIHDSFVTPLEPTNRHPASPNSTTLIQNSLPSLLDDDKIHIVFSTGCNTFQDWQSYVFFFQIWKAGQSGHVTRIVSGCRNVEDEQTIRSIFEEQIRLGIPTGRDRFHIHVTPDYSDAVPNVNFKFLNKPFGVVHWMENALNMPSNLSQYADTMFILLDPDQIVIRPFSTRDFSQDGMPLQWLTKAKRHILQEGHPISQYYAFGVSWTDKVNSERQRVIDTAWNAIKDNPAFSEAMKTTSHLYNWTGNEVNERYAAGPPYIALGPDLYRISVLWAGVAVPVYELTKDHLSEMFMYSTAAAHLEMPHDLAYDFMFSNPEADVFEIWQPVDDMPVKDLCKHTISDNSDPLNVQYRNRLPHILHYCQEYYHGPYYFFKYFLPEDFLSCGHPLLLDPADHDAEGSPFVLALSYNSTIYKTYDGRPPSITFPHRQRHTFSLCHIISRVNEATQFWKEQFCTPETANFNKLFTIRSQ